MPNATRRKPSTEPAVLGWREHVSLPALGLGPLLAKIDTGARWCALHAEDIRVVGAKVYFGVRCDGSERRCSAPMIGRKRIRSSNGSIEDRVMIETEVQVGSHRFPAKITLTDRTDMNAPMLLGRDSIGGRFLVDPRRKFVASGAKEDAPRK